VVIPLGAELIGATNPDGSLVVSWEGHRVNGYGLSGPDGELGPSIVVPLPIPPSVMAMDNEAATLMLEWWPDFPWEAYHFGGDVDLPAVKAKTRERA
jgi:hypothetical protein